MTRTKEKIPVYLLTGFLGAGKTTLLNQMLENPALNDTALVINEFGLVPIDNYLVREGKERPVVASAGCICCTIGSDLRSSLNELLAERRSSDGPQFSRVIIETTGLADPAPIINSLIPGGIEAVSMSDHWVARAFELINVITVVDVETINDVLDAHPESLKQIAFADHIVLTRTSGDIEKALENRLQQINPSLTIHDSGNDQFDPSSLIRSGSYSERGKSDNLTHWLRAERVDAHHHDHQQDHQHEHNRNRHGDVEAIPLTRDEPVALATLEAFLSALTQSPGMDVLRIKGLVALTDDRSSPGLVHAVQHRLYPIASLDHWPQGFSDSRLVVIGTRLNKARLQQEFANLK